MKKTVLTLILVFSLSVLASNSFAYKQVITAAEIERAGVSRINDILRLTDEWWITTIDGYTWWTSPGGLESYRGQNFKVMIDGQLIPLEIFDTQHLERLPIAITQIDSVVFISSPGIHYGVSTDRGLIHFFTRKPGEGLSIRGTRFGGNESGEPGPWKFVPQYYSENVDRIGPDYSGTVSFKTPGGFWSTLAARGQFQFNADSLMLQRLNYIYPYATPRNSHLAFSATGGFKLFDKEFRYLAGNSTIDEYYFFFVPFSNEVPVTGVLNHAGLSSVPNAEKGELNYSFSYSQQDFQKYKNAFDWDLDYTATTYYGKIDWSSPKREKGIESNVGLSYKHFEQDSEINFAEPLKWDFVDLYGSLLTKVSPGNYFETTLDITYQDKKFAPKATQSFTKAVSTNFSIELIGSYSVRMVTEDNPTWNLYGNGFSAIPDMNSVATIYRNEMDDTGDDLESTTIRLEAVARHHYSDTFEYYFGGYFNNEVSRNFTWSGFYTDPNSIKYFGYIKPNIYRYLLILDNHGSETGFKFGFRKNWTEKCTHILSYRAFGILEQSKSNTIIWGGVPQNRITYKFEYRMDQTFSIYVQANYYGESTWWDYSSYYDDFSYDVDDLFFVDVSATKSLFKEKLNLNFRFRNIFEDKMIWHPIGGVNHDLTYNIQVWVLLDQIWNPFK